jgi:hypothetical protein
MLPFDPLPSPRELFRALDAGSISREAFQSCMAAHARELIEEMEEAHTNPIAAFVEQLFNRREASRLSGQHGELLVREVLFALAELPDFPPARWLWNASHSHIPLHIFFRTRRAPIFRITQMQAWPQRISIHVEHGAPEKGATMVETIELRRHRQGQLIVEHRVIAVR